ncbi:hypothetical protein E3N88_21775 [Mikania micrantha]|uniref:Uncharacterized protein n=1 Tax=Mikania micrantha TaxID=192012 RepID=A0A5N6N8X7_9ASTR|nr:hypothetical protein E3N88_21775 [Mikania micrantha]
MATSITSTETFFSFGIREVVEDLDLKKLHKNTKLRNDASIDRYTRNVLSFEIGEVVEGLLLDFYSDPEKAKRDKITISEVVSSILNWFSLTLVVAGNYFSMAGSCNFDFYTSSWKRKPNEEILILREANAKKGATYVEQRKPNEKKIRELRMVPLDIYVSMRNRKPNEQHLLLSELCYFAFMRARENESQKRRQLYRVHIPQVVENLLLHIFCLLDIICLLDRAVTPL